MIFLKNITSRWNIAIQLNKDLIIKKKVDNFSSLLFVLCMDLLSRKINGFYLKVNVYTDNECYITNHFLFIDDLKLLVTSDETVVAIVDETKTFSKTIGL
ncbi:hypothetical protein NUSPORA_00705 [Nucleospora cyclopteri]